MKEYEITQECIDECLIRCRAAKDNNLPWADCCPVSQTVKRAEGYSKVMSFGSNVTAILPRGQIVRLKSNRATVDFIKSFDRYMLGKSKGTKVKPTTIKVGPRV